MTDENKEAIVEETPINMTEDIVKMVDDESKGVYTPNEDPNTPDYDYKKIEKTVSECTYLELPLWKKKLTQMRDNLTMNYEQAKAVPKLREIIDRTKREYERTGKTMSAEEELQLMNQVQQMGGNLEIKLKSIIDKYDVNTKFLDEQLKIIEERMEQEELEVMSYPTSKKTEMLIDMVNRHVTAAESNPDTKPHQLNSLHDYRKSLLSAYDDRDDLDWLQKKIESDKRGLSSIYRLYQKNYCNDDDLEKLIEKTFGFTHIPNVPSIASTDVISLWQFFVYYLAYISNLSNGKRIDIKRRIIKEKCIIIFQNLGDCEIGLFDIGKREDESNKENALRYYEKIVEIVKLINFTIGNK